MIIPLHPPPPYHHHHHRNSTSTRNNDPRGLKFCRQGYQAKLTTIQYNFNPTIFRGGSHILHLGLTLPVFLDKTNFGFKSIRPTFFDTIFFTQKFNQNFFTKNFLTLNIFLIKFFFEQETFVPQHFFGPNHF